MRECAPIFAALGDEERLSLVEKLGGGHRFPIFELAKDTHLTRQAITKHLRTLERAGVLHSARSGRECLFRFHPRPVQRARDYLQSLSGEWGSALMNFKDFVESDEP